MKKILSLILCLVCAVSMMGVAVAADTPPAECMLYAADDAYGARVAADLPGIVFTAEDAVTATLYCGDEALIVNTLTQPFDHPDGFLTCAFYMDRLTDGWWTGDRIFTARSNKLPDRLVIQVGENTRYVFAVSKLATTGGTLDPSEANEENWVKMIQSSHMINVPADTEGATVVSASADPAFVVEIPATVDFGKLAPKDAVKTLPYQVRIKSALLETDALVIVSLQEDAVLTMHDQDGNGPAKLPYTLLDAEEAEVAAGGAFCVFRWTDVQNEDRAAQSTGALTCDPGRLEAAGSYKDIMTFDIAYRTDAVD